jgi:hypothetical protein
MTREDRFCHILGEVESGGDQHQWGDNGRACGRFQWHPSAIITWAPLADEFGGEERSWDWFFELAVRHFHRRARKHLPAASDLTIAIAYHLHGQLRSGGWDAAYAERWLKIEAATPPADAE